MHPTLPQEVFIGLALVVSLTAALFDVRTGHIPNWLTVGALALGVVLRVVAGAVEGLDGLRASAIFVACGVVLCSLVPLLLWRFARLGGGDLKLLAALGAICGPFTGFRAQSYAFMAMFVYVLGRYAYEGKLFRLLFRSVGLLLWRFRSKPTQIAAELLEPLRFAPAILVGVCLALVLDWSVI